MGDGNNVAHSLMVLGAKAGMEVAVATPAQLSPHHAGGTGGGRPRRARRASDASPRIPAAAADGAAALYADVWVSMGDDESTADARREMLAPYRLDGELLAHARDDAVVLHCLPAHPGEEITEDLLYGERSAVWDQAENRLHAQKALLELLRLLTQPLGRAPRAASACALRSAARCASAWSSGARSCGGAGPPAARARLARLLAGTRGGQLLRLAPPPRGPGAALGHAARPRERARARLVGRLGRRLREGARPAAPPAPTRWPWRSSAPLPARESVALRDAVAVIVISPDPSASCLGGRALRGGGDRAAGREVHRDPGAAAHGEAPVHRAALLDRALGVAGGRAVVVATDPGAPPPAASAIKAMIDPHRGEREPDRRPPRRAQAAAQAGLADRRLPCARG